MTRPANHARAAATAVRSLNHATLRPPRAGWADPADAYDVIGSLDQMACGLPQALGQVLALLDRHQGNGTLRSTRDSAGDHAAAQAALGDAVTAAQHLQAALARAHTATSSLYSA